MKLASRREFLLAVAQARKDRGGLAASKLGYSEQAWLVYPQVKEKVREPRQRAAALAWLRVHAYRQSGIFPDDEAPLIAFIDRYAAMCNEMDFLAYVDGWPGAVASSASSAPTFVAIDALEPDRSNPYDEENCYLPSFEGAKVLVVSSMADLLVERATKETYERVWSKIGAEWFQPSKVEALTFPYIYDETVQAQHSSVWDIYEEVVEQMRSRDFDVALIAAAGLGLPLAHAAKKLGAIGISLGGHLQVMFGVHGKRWQQDSAWSSLYVNDSWITPPPRMRPVNARGLADDGAYW